MLHDKAWFPRLSVLFVSNKEAPLDIIAGRDGLDLLVLQFPEDDND